MSTMLSKVIVESIEHSYDVHYILMDIMGINVSNGMHEIYLMFNISECGSQKRRKNVRKMVDFEKMPL